MFTPRSAPSLQAADYTVDYLIVPYTDGRLRFHCHFMIQSRERCLSAENMVNARRRWHHSQPNGELFRRHRRLLICSRGVHQSPGRDNLPVHIKSRAADELVRARPEIALIYGVITEFFCSIDIPGCLCRASCVWLITMKLSGLRGRRTGLMLPVVWCVWWHISCSNHKSYRGMLYYTAVSSMSARPGWESNQIR